MSPNQQLLPQPSCPESETSSNAIVSPSLSPGAAGTATRSHRQLRFAHSWEALGKPCFSPFRQNIALQPCAVKDVFSTILVEIISLFQSYGWKQRKELGQAGPAPAGRAAQHAARRDALHSAKRLTPAPCCSPVPSPRERRE